MPLRSTFGGTKVENFTMPARAAENTVAEYKGTQKHWVVTFNNPQPLLHYAGEGESFEITLVGPPPAACKTQAAWWVGQLEKAPSTGQLHLQMHVCFKSKVSFRGVKHFFDSSNFSGAHFEPCKDVDASLKYVVKEESREMGPYRSPGAPAPGAAVQGRRNDLEVVVKAAQGGARVEELWQRFPMIMVRNHRGIERLCQQLSAAPARPAMNTVVFYGAPGTGKSTLAAKLAADLFPEDAPFYKPIGKWFCGYHGQDAIILDDFDGKGQACREIKNIFDKTPCIVETKGGQVNLRNSLAVVTSNRNPRTWFPHEEPVDIAAVLRRCLFFRVEESLVVNAGKADGFGLNEAGLFLLERVKRCLREEVELGDGHSGARGDAGLRAQEDVYVPYKDQIIRVPVTPVRGGNGFGAPQEVVAVDDAPDDAMVVVDDSSDDETPETVEQWSESEGESVGCDLYYSDSSFDAPRAKKRKMD